MSATGSTQNSAATTATTDQLAVTTLGAAAAGVANINNNHTKQVTFNPNPVTIPLSESTAASPHINTLSNAPSSIKGTIPIQDTSDPTKIKNVLVSLPASGGGAGGGAVTDHTYAKLSTPPSEDADEGSSSSSDSSSGSDSEVESEEKPKSPETPPAKVAKAPPVVATPVPPAVAPPVPRKRGRPRKYPLPTAQSVPPKRNNTSSATKQVPSPRSILKPSSAPTTPVRSKSEGKEEKIRRRGRGCGSCVGCVREDCGKCSYCLDKPKYGGPGRKKQRCALRICSQFVSVGKRSMAAKSLPNTSKSAAILSMAQTLVAAAAASNGEPITLAIPMQQASEPSQNHLEIPIVKLPEEALKQIAAPAPMSPTAPPPPSKPAEQPKSKQVTTPTSSSATSSPSVKGSRSSMGGGEGDNIMKCVVCKRERKIKLAKTAKFCTLRCMKLWMDINPGQNPDDATPNDKNMLCMPPTTSITDAPRAIKKLLIDMALPGSQPTGPSVGSAPISANMISTLSDNLSTILNATTAATSTCTNGLKRTGSQELPNLPAKKLKESSASTVAVTAVTKPVATPVATKSTTSTVKTPAKKKGPNDLPVDVSKWGVSEVVKYFQSKPDCQSVAPMLEEQEVDGQALLLLTHDSLVKCLDIKLGPALKIMTHVEQLKQQQATHT